MTPPSVNRTLDNTCYRLAREVREHPLLSLSVALGVGAVLGVWAGQAAASPRSRKNWLSDVASDLSDHAHHAGNRALRARRRASKELSAVAGRAHDALPDLDFDHLSKRGRHWLRSVLG